jgi:transketolase
MKQIFGQTMFKLAEQDPNVVILLCDVTFPGSEEFEKRFPNRLYNFGITEQTTAGIAAGMASQGLKPVFYTIAPFLLERCFEFIKVDIDGCNLPVMLVGYDYENYYGSTHTCLDAKKMVGLFKNVVGYFPETEKQAEDAIIEAHKSNKPSFILLNKIKNDPK